MPIILSALKSGRNQSRMLVSINHSFSMRTHREWETAVSFRDGDETAHLSISEWCPNEKEAVIR